MKKILSVLVIGAFAFGLGVFNIQTASAAHFNKAGYSTKKPEPPKKVGREKPNNRQHSAKKFR